MDEGPKGVEFEEDRGWGKDVIWKNVGENKIHFYKVTKDLIQHPLNLMRSSLLISRGSSLGPKDTILWLHHLQKTE